jgi:hypothetical protein
MKSFVLDSHMTTIRGVFYPTGHVVIMLPDENAAHEACRALTHASIAGEEISLLSPEVIMDDIARTVGNADMPLPSPGTEADTVRQLTHLAAQGQWGLLVHAPHAKDSDKVMAALKGHPVTYAQKYRQLVIEDLA